MRPVADHFPWFTTDLTQGYVHIIDGRPVVRFPATWEKAGEKQTQAIDGGKDSAEIQTYKILTWSEHPLVLA